MNSIVFCKKFIKLKFQEHKLENLDIDTFSVSDSPIKELTYYSNYVMNLNVQELVSTIEFIVEQKIKNFR